MPGPIRPAPAGCLAVLLLAPVLLAGCASPPRGPMVSTCQIAIAERVGRPVTDVTPIDVVRARQGTSVRAEVAGADAPWACSADSSGAVLSVLYTGS